MKQLKSKNITIRGIERNSNDVNVKDGASDEIINLRYKDGAWRPVGSKDDAGYFLPTINDGDLLYSHPVQYENEDYDLSRNLITANYGDATYNYAQVILQGLSTGGFGLAYTLTTIKTFTNSVETIVSFAHLNNIIIVITTLQRYFFIWDNDSNTYVELEEIPMPEFYVGPGDWQQDNNSATATTWDESYNRLISMKNSYEESGYIPGRSFTFVRFAYKLYDGSYVNHSIPVCIISYGEDITDSYLGGVPIRMRETGGSYYYNISYFTPEYLYYLTTNQKNILEKYKGVITSLSIFVTNPKNLFSDVPAEQDLWDNPGGGSNYYPPYINEDISENMAEITFEEQINYYLVKDITLEDLIGDDLAAPASFLLPQNLVNKETLTIDNFTHHKVWGQTNYNYNSRLHFGNITTKFCKPTNPFFYPPTYTNTTTSNYYYKIKVWINTDKGEKIVVSEDYTEYRKTLIDQYDPLLNNQIAGDSHLFLLNTIIGYPDRRAYKITITRERRLVEEGAYYAEADYTYNLKPHPFLNIAYAITGQLYNAPLVEFYNSVYDLVARTIIDETAFDDDEEDMAEDNYLTDENRVQVSKLDNALVYEAVNSYQVGNNNESVIGFGSVVEPLSIGQFGQFPLYVFTTAGIFVLEQGSGDILYSNILPLNREVCNNVKSITDIGGGVVYSTEKGLNIISGKEIIEISQILEGEPKQHLVDNSTYQEYLNDENFVQLLSDLSTVNFLTYLEDAIIGYDYNNKEIIVCNNSYTFSYVYNLESKTWHKIKEVFDLFVKSIPDTFGYLTEKFYDLKEESFDYIHTLIQSRPIKLDTQGYKGINELILRGWFDVKELTYAGVYLFGSLNGKNYVFLRGVTPQDDNTYDDIYIRKLHTLFKYLIVVFTGQLNDSSINYIETTYFEKYNNKLR